MGPVDMVMDTVSPPALLPFTAVHPPGLPPKGGRVPVCAQRHCILPPTCWIRRPCGRGVECALPRCGDDPREFACSAWAAARARERTDLVAFRVKTAQWWPLVGCHAACRRPHINQL